MLSILKCRLHRTGKNVIAMPAGARVLCVQSQDNTPTLWVAADEDSPQELREFTVALTGHYTVSSGTLANYIGTVQLNGGMLVLHVFGDR